MLYQVFLLKVLGEINYCPNNAIVNLKQDYGAILLKMLLFRCFSFS